MDADEEITLPSCESVSIVDLDSYPPFVSEQADRLDLMAHLQQQMDRLTAFVWDVPEGPLHLRLHVTDDHRAMERLTYQSRPPSASGTVRTHGKLCLAGPQRMLECARDDSHGLLKGGSKARSARPHLFTVPPGIFYILVYYQWPRPPDDHANGAPSADRSRHYDVYLHHYPHPAPRVSPVRLPGFVPSAG